VISGKICNSLPLLVARRPFLFTASVSFDLPTGLALLIVVAVTAGVSTFFYFALRTYRPKLRAILILIRASYTLGLLLIILDAAFVRGHEERSRLLIVKSDSPMMRLRDAREGKTRDEVAGDVSRILIGDAKLRGQFSVEQLTGSAGDEAGFEIGGTDAPPAAVVSLTDTSDASIAEAQNIAGLTPAPLFVMPVSAEARTPDVSVNFVDCAGTASLDIPTTLRAVLYGRGMAGRSTLVKLSDEALALSSTVAHWKEDSETITVPLMLAPRVEGLHRYTVRAETCDGELNSENNEISFSVEVRRAERRVLFMENQPTWEGKFIRRALEENRSIVVDYFAQVSRSAVLGRQQTESSPSPWAVIGDFKKLAAYDCIIVGPTDSSSITERAARNLTAFVERRGGGLVILGGNDFAGSILSPSSPLSHLSPAQVAASRRSDVPRGANAKSPETGSQSQVQGASGSGRAIDRAILTPTEEGRGLFWSADGNKQMERLGPLSESYAQVKSLKAGAVVLAIDGSRKQPGGPALIAAQPYGYGRTLLFAPSDSWKIGLAESSDNRGAFALLWQNLVLWSAVGAEPASSIRLHAGAVESGDTVRAYLVARDDSFNPAAQLSLRGAVEFDGSEKLGHEKAGHTVKLPLTITHDPDLPGVYQLNAPAVGEGNALLSVAVRFKGGGEQSLSLPFYVQASRAAWRESPDVDERLRIIARASEGELFKPDELELLMSRLANLRATHRAVREAHRLRESVALAFLLPVLMSLEYFLRKRHSAG
jgi:hypothetical protein